MGGYYNDIAVFRNLWYSFINKFKRNRGRVGRGLRMFGRVWTKNVAAMSVLGPSQVKHLKKFISIEIVIHLLSSILPTVYWPKIKLQESPTYLPRNQNDREAAWSWIHELAWRYRVVNGHIAYTSDFLLPCLISETYYIPIKTLACTKKVTNV